MSEAARPRWKIRVQQANKCNNETGRYNHRHSSHLIAVLQTHQAIHVTGKWELPHLLHCRGSQPHQSVDHAVPLAGTPTQEGRYRVSAQILPVHGKGRPIAQIDGTLQRSAERHRVVVAHPSTAGGTHGEPSQIAQPEIK